MWRFARLFLVSLLIRKNHSTSSAHQSIDTTRSVAWRFAHLFLVSLWCFALQGNGPSPITHSHTNTHSHTHTFQERDADVFACVCFLNLKIRFYLLRCVAARREHAYMYKKKMNRIYVLYISEHAPLVLLVFRICLYQRAKN